MARKRYKPDEIVAKLRQVDVLVSQGQEVVGAVRRFLKVRLPHAACRTPAARPDRA